MRQYYQPPGGFNVGDCMPFFHDGVFHLYYLLDEGHHRAGGGLGGHQWAHASTRDLAHWEEHPLALAAREEWEASICTGSVLHRQGLYHAFYAVRRPDWSQHFGQAVSRDGISFQKLPPPPTVALPPGFTRDNFRDPCAFTDATGRVQLLLTAQAGDYPLRGHGGCLLRFSSGDLETWQPEGVFLVPGDRPGCDIPECADHFCWNGWHYLLFGLGLKTYYRMSRQPLGPWRRPAADALDGYFCAVMKTAAYGGDRRIGVGWAGPRIDRDDSGIQFGGRAVFREMVQRGDGTLGTRFVPELAVPTAGPLPVACHALTAGVRAGPGQVEITDAPGLEVGYADLPVPNVRLRCRVRVSAETVSYGLGLRGAGAYEKRCDLRVDCRRRELTLAGESLLLAGDPRAGCQLEVILLDDLLDVCFNGEQCLINRCPELVGNRLFFFVDSGSARFDEIHIEALAARA